MHDFKDEELGKAIPYGVYDLADDSGWLSVGIDRDTAQFAVASIGGWWEQLGRDRYADATTLTPARHQQVEQNRAPADEAEQAHNWRAKPLVSLEVIINLIAATTTAPASRLRPARRARRPRQDQGLRRRAGHRPTSKATASTPTGTTPSNRELEDRRTLTPLAALAAGCGTKTINTDQAETEIANGIEEQTRLSDVTVNISWRLGGGR